MDQVNNGQNNSPAKKRFWPSKGTLLTVTYVALILIFAAGLGVLAQWLAHRSSDGKNTVTGLPTKVDDVQNLRLAGKQSEANKKIDEALSDPNTSASIKQQLYVQKGYAAMETGDFQAAADAFAKAVEILPDPDIYRMLGEAYFQLGKKADARAAYVKGIDLIKANGGDTGSGLANDLQQRIDIIDGKIKPE